MAPPGQGAGARRPRRWLAVLAIVVGLALVALFGVRTWRQLQFDARVRSGEVQVETLRGWMTLPYIARTYGVPEADLRTALGAPADGHGERSLRDWLTAAGRDPVAGRHAIEALILKRRPAASGAAP